MVSDLAMAAAALRRYRYSYAHEDSLQAGLVEALGAEGLSATREVWLGQRDRLDIIVGRVGIEVKVAGSVDSVLRQLQRYAASDQLDALLLFTTRATHLGLPTTVGGKPLEVVYQGGAA